jgi:hypothetical protein
MCTILLCGLLVMAGCASAWRWLFNRSMARVNPTNRSPFCSRHPAVCMRNRYYASLLRDYRHTRDAQLDPTGRRTTIKRGGNKLEECDPTTKLHYDDSRITEWWGHMLPGQEEGLYACPTPCSVAGERGEADVLVRMFEPTRRSEMSVRQKAAVINTEAHSLSKAGLEATDLLISYSRLADVVVGCVLISLHGTGAPTDWHLWMRCACFRLQRFLPASHLISSHQFSSVHFSLCVLRTDGDIPTFGSVQRLMYHFPLFSGIPTV